MNLNQTSRLGLRQGAFNKHWTGLSFLVVCCLLLSCSAAVKSQAIANEVFSNKKEILIFVEKTVQQNLPVTYPKLMASIGVATYQVDQNSATDPVNWKNISIPLNFLPKELTSFNYSFLNKKSTSNEVNLDIYFSHFSACLKAQQIADALGSDFKEIPFAVKLHPETLPAEYLAVKDWYTEQKRIQYSYRLQNGSLSSVIFELNAMGCMRRFFYQTN